MADLHWFTLTPPRNVDLAALTALLRPLANRPRLGLLNSTPLAIFETWSIGGQISWRLGLDARIARDFPSQLRAQLPRLGIAVLGQPERPALTLAADVRLDSVMSALRLDTAASVADGIIHGLRGIGRSETAVLHWVIGPSHQRTNVPPDALSLGELLAIRRPRTPDGTARRLWGEKTAEPLFAVRGRIGAAAATTGRASAILRGIGSALKLANSAHASLRLGKAGTGRARKLIEVPQPLSWSALNAAELAAVLGWPLQDQVSDDLPTVGGHVNPVPEQLLLAEAASDQPGARVLGESLHPAQRGELVQVPVDTCLRHLHVIGPTGSGKSTLLAGLVAADMAAGRGVLVLEPRGDLVQDILARVPTHRREDVVVIDPAASDRVVGINVLAGERDQAERRADQLVALLAELHGANFGPRTTDIALHALIAVSRLKNGTLPDVVALLTNRSFRRRALAEVNDPLTLSPFFAGFDALSDAERGQHVAPLLNKLRGFLSRPAVRRMLGQAQPRFDLEELFTRRRIVLINLNEGMLGKPAASLLGALILNQFWAAAQRRASVPRDHRHPVMAVIDEVQNYLHVPGIEIGELFAQCRGLGVSLTVAHQHLDQLSASQRAGLLANARSRVVFRPAQGDAKLLAAALGGGLTGDDLLRLRVYQACASLLTDGQPSAPFSVATRPLPPWTSDPHELRLMSADRYGIDGMELDQALTERWQGGGGTPDGPVGVRRRATK